ncbi:MAG: SAM hydroxide adenosyltransferase, partial [Pseudomonadota bacterium]
IAELDVENGDRAADGFACHLDIQFGNVWTNIPQATLEELDIAKDDMLAVEISEASESKYSGEIPYVYTFSDVPEGDPLIYINSIGNVAVALNYDNFAATHGIGSGADWQITLSK